MAADPLEHQPVTEGIDRDGDEFIWWFTDSEKDPSCDYCKAGRCAQRVLRYAKLDSEVIIHNDPRKDMH